MGEQQQSNMPTASKRRRIVAVALAVGVALFVGIGAWVLQANQGSAALSTVAAEKAQEATSISKEQKSKSTSSSSGSSTTSSKDAASKKKGDSGKNANSNGSSSSSAEKSSQQKSQAKPEEQQEVVEIQEVPEEVEQIVEEPVESMEGAASEGTEAQDDQGSTENESREEAQQEPEQTSIAVQVVVDGSPAGGSQRDESVELDVGANAYDALVACGADVNARYTVYGTYVAAIDGLAEKEHGSMSGWVYAVNGVEPSTACSNYVLQDGDVVVWTYVNVED